MVDHKTFESTPPRSQEQPHKAGRSKIYLGFEPGNLLARYLLGSYGKPSIYLALCHRRQFCLVSLGRDELLVRLRPSFQAKIEVGNDLLRKGKYLQRIQLVQR